MSGMGTTPSIHGSDQSFAEISADNRPATQADKHTDRDPLEDGAVSVFQDHALDLSRRRSNDIGRNLPRSMGDAM
jgi:hypothetical protein